MVLADDCYPYEKALKQELETIRRHWIDAALGFEDAYNFNYNKREPRKIAQNDTQASRMLDLLENLIDEDDWQEFKTDLGYFLHTTGPDVLTASEDANMEHREFRWGTGVYVIVFQCTGQRISDYKDTKWDREYDKAEYDDCFSDDVPIGIHSTITSRSSVGPSVIQICPKLLKAWGNNDHTTFMSKLDIKKGGIWAGKWPNLLYPFRRLLMQAITVTPNVGDLHDVPITDDFEAYRYYERYDPRWLKKDGDTYAKFVLGIRAIRFCHSLYWTLPDNEVS